MERVNELTALQGSAINEAKEALAYEVTRIVHGAEEADKALAAAKSLFAGGAEAEIPAFDITENELGGGMALPELLEKMGLAPSRAEARRLIQQGGISVNDEKVTDFSRLITAEAFADGEIMVQKGKKVHRKVRLV
jgi:tyrosyl-tRNA synthetase